MLEKANQQISLIHAKPSPTNYPLTTPQQSEKSKKASDFLTPNQVQTWFDKTVELKQYNTFFNINKVDGETLFEIGDKDLEEMGMLVRVHRLRSIRAIEALKNSI